MLTPPTLDLIASQVDAAWRIDALWIFGSAASDTMRPDSDLDIAVLVQRLPTSLERFDLQEEIARQVGRPVDLVVINDASPILVSQILKSGRRVVTRSPTRTADFEARAPSLYHDLKRVRAEAENALLGRYLRG